MRQLAFNILLLLFLARVVPAAEPVLVPGIDGEFWQIAGDPDLGKYTTPKQQPVDFGIWRAADGTWQLWSCIRGTSTPGRTRLLYRWQAKKLTDTNWNPMGIHDGRSEFRRNRRRTSGALCSHAGLRLQMFMAIGFYGNWEHIARALSNDGKTFARQLTSSGMSGMFRRRRRKQHS